MSILDGEDYLVKPSTFSIGYIEDVFMIWYKSGKPGHTRLAAMVPPDPTIDRRPTPEGLRGWIEKWYRPKADILDAEIFQQISDRFVKEKVEMLERHVEIAKNMQSTALDVLKERRDEITPNSAIRLLIEGIQIEQNASGIPDALRKMTKMSDDDLIGEIEKIIGNAEVEILPPEV